MNRQHMLAEMRRRAWERHQQALLAHRHMQYPHRASDENVIFYGGAPPSISGVGALKSLKHARQQSALPRGIVPVLGQSAATLARQARFGNAYAAAALQKLMQAREPSGARIYIDANDLGIFRGPLRLPIAVPAYWNLPNGNQGGTTSLPVVWVSPDYDTAVVQWNITLGTDAAGMRAGEYYVANLYLPQPVRQHPSGESV